MLLEACLALTSVNYHKNEHVPVLLNQWLAQTMLPDPATGLLAETSRRYSFSTLEPTDIADILRTALSNQSVLAYLILLEKFL